MKKYLLKIDSTHGATLAIRFNSDSTRPVFIDYCGRDTGARYINIGNAARYLETIAAQWGPETVKTYGTAEKIPITGCSEWNNALLRAQYCGGRAPSFDDYLKSQRGEKINN